MQDNQQQQFLPSPNPVFIQGLYTLISRGLALSVEMLLRQPGTFGTRYLGAQTVIPMAAIPCLLAYMPDHDPRPLLSLLAAYVALAVFNLLLSARRRWRGDAFHSYYDGLPWLQGRRSRFSESTTKNILEPFVVAVFVVFFWERNQPLALYLVVATSAMIGCNLQAYWAMRRRVMDMNDAVAEQQIVAEQFRDLRGNRF